MTDPFRLGAGALAWVDATLAAMTERQVLSQLFTLLSVGDDDGMIEAQARFQPGGVTRVRGGDAAAERRLLARLNGGAPAPLLVSADLEGSRMSLGGGVEWPNPLAVAALDDPVLTRDLAFRMGREAAAHGINWTFTPLLDLAATHRSPIVASRSFGADPGRVLAHALAQVEGSQAAGLAATLKHWPGEGLVHQRQTLPGSTQNTAKLTHRP